jgi:hypothetical protein
LAAGDPGKELVRAGAHRLKNQVGFRSGRDRKDGRRRVCGPEPLDGGHAGGRIRTQVDDGNVGAGAIGAATGIDDAHRNAAGAHHLRGLPFEFLIVADDERCELGHGSR